MLAPWQRRVFSPWLAGLLLLPACRGDGRPTEPSAATEVPAGSAGEVIPEPAGGDAAASADEAGDTGDTGEPADTAGESGEAGASEGASADAGAGASAGDTVADAGSGASGGDAGGGSGASKAGPPPLPSPIFGKGNPSCGRDPGVGQPIKSFSLPLTNGKTVTSQNLKGKVVLLNFWGTWCKPCLKELPEFDRLYRRYRKNGLVLLAIATDTEAEGVVNFAKENKLAAKLATGGEELANSYKSPNFPFSFVVDENGIIQASYRGFKPECLGQLEQDIRGQLDAK